MEHYMNGMKDKCVAWIREYFAQNGPNCNAIVGISGGKDSSIVAALCVEALGKDRVIGVLMPCGIQDDIGYSIELVKYLGIKYYTVNIGQTVNTLLNSIEADVNELSRDTKVNLPARIRMTTLFAVSQTCNGRVANTCNYSEDWVGYSTLFGDGAGQFAPLGKLTVQEVKFIGKELGLPNIFIDKTPSDGLSGKTDEDNLGFTYEALDTYIRTGRYTDEAIRDMIDQKHRANKFKMELMPAFNPGLGHIMW